MRNRQAKYSLREVVCKSLMLRDAESVASWLCRQAALKFLGVTFSDSWGIRFSGVARDLFLNQCGKRHGCTTKTLATTRSHPI